MLGGKQPARLTGGYEPPPTLVGEVIVLGWVRVWLRATPCVWKTLQSMMPDVGVHTRLAPVREEEMPSFRTHHTAVVLGHGLAYDGVSDAFPHRDPPDVGLQPGVGVYIEEGYERHGEIISRNMSYGENL